MADHVLLRKKQAHPSLTESECKKLCKLIDCQKLSQDASSHAAQNDRLPIQMVVRVLYFEQLRLKSSFSGGGSGCVSGLGLGADGSFSQRFVCSSSGVPSSCVSPQRDNYASLRRENRELKLEISRMRVRLTELEREQGLMKQQGRMRGDGGGGGGRPGEQGRAFLASLSRGFGRITMFGVGGPAAADRRRKKSGRSSQCSDGKARRRQKASFAYD